MSTYSASFIGSIPENYDTYLGPFLFDPYAADLVERVNALPHAYILEIACGTGRVTQHLADLPETSITATDLNADMIAYAQTKVKHPHVEWKVADAQQLPFEDGVFDLVVCQFGFMFMPDKPKAFGEAFRVLKKGGHVLFSTWDRVENNLPAYISRQVVKAFFEGDPPVFYYTPFSMYDQAEIRSLLEEAGFNHISIELLHKQGTSPKAHDAARGFIKGNPIYLEIINRDPGSILTIEKQLTDELVRQLGDEPLTCRLSAIVSIAGKDH